MQRALSLAEKGRGYVSPNPMVGCVIVSKEEELIGEGFHERFGKEHAEVDAIDDDPLMRNLFYVMHRDFLVYLKPNQYSKKRDMPFSSPYEAFVHVQNTVFQLELLLKKTS